MSSPVSIRHASLGEVCAAPDELFQLPGLPGFPEARRFAARQHDGESAFAWLVCFDCDDLAFVIADPWSFVPDYAPELGARAFEAVDYAEGDPLQLVAIARVTADSATLNLAAPLLLNLRSRRGLQVILEKGDYSTRHVAVETAAAAAPPPAAAVAQRD